MWKLEGAAGCAAYDIYIGLRFGGLGILRVESLGIGADVEKILSQRKVVSFSNPLAPGSGLANKTTVHSQI